MVKQKEFPYSTRDCQVCNEKGVTYKYDGNIGHSICTNCGSRIFTKAVLEKLLGGKK